jgi:hypothetical protein
MNPESVRIIFSHAIALILIVGGLVFLFFAMDKPSATTSGLLVVVGGFVGAAIQFVFGGGQAAQATTSFERGVSTTPQPNTLTTPSSEPNTITDDPKKAS